MWEFIVQNFNWFTFFLALGVFALLQSIVNFLIARSARKRARQRTAVAEQKYQELKGKFETKKQEYDQILGTKEAK
ncbi:MAG: hypothetical protein JW782_02935 [Candidatus Saganbacteria bacterium]|nr:hypothetical protein [Candidatus Saganbacteria bacterium]